MPDTKQELDIELTRLAQLATRTAGLPVDEDDQELLESLVLQHAEQVKASWLTERVERAVKLLYPGYDKRMGEEAKPLRWPLKDWWWNGARVTEMDVRANGDIRVDLRSYVGCGETDDIHGFVLPRAWIEADDQVSLIHEACRQERARLASKTQAEALAQAQRDAEAAVARLAQLKGGSNAA